MARQLTIAVKPETPIVSADSISQILFARLKYTRELPSDDQDTGAPQTVKLEGSRPEELDGAGSASIHVEDYADGTTVTVQIEAPGGTVFWESDDLAPGAVATDLDVIVPDTVFAAASERSVPT